LTADPANNIEGIISFGDSSFSIKSMLLLLRYGLLNTAPLPHL